MYHTVVVNVCCQSFKNVRLSRIIEVGLYFCDAKIVALQSHGRDVVVVHEGELDGSAIVEKVLELRHLCRNHLSYGLDVQEVVAGRDGCAHQQQRYKIFD